jgi:hypothetical protein
LPGVPVSITTEGKDFSIKQKPAASNNWRGVTIQSKKKKDLAVKITWTVTPPQ